MSWLEPLQGFRDWQEAGAQLAGKLATRERRAHGELSLKNTGANQVVGLVGKAEARAAFLDSHN